MNNDVSLYDHLARLAGMKTWFIRDEDSKVISAKSCDSDDEDFLVNDYAT